MRLDLARFATSLVLPFALSFALGCDATPPAPAAVRAVSLTEVRLQLSAPSDFSLASLFQPRVAADPGANTDIRWSISDSVRARILDGGVLRLCESIADLVVTATSVADSTKKAVAHATVTEMALPWVSITSLLDAGTGAPVDVNALRGDVLVGVSGIEERRLRCNGLSRIELSVITAQNDVIAVEGRSFEPAAKSLPAQSFRWSTTSVPNGTYRLRLRVYLDGRADPVGTTTSGDFPVRN
jgi:hypothetical protein